MGLSKNLFLRWIHPENRESGVTVVAVIIAVFLLSVLGSELAYLTSSNQRVRIHEVSGEQAFYSVQAGLEYSLGKVLREGSDEISFAPTFSGETLTITRLSNQITVSSSELSAMDSHTIADPDPPGSADCLVVDISRAYIQGNNKIKGITLRRVTECFDPVTITSMTGTTWKPDDGLALNQIMIEGPPNEFTSPPDGSDGTFDFGPNDYVIDDFGVHEIDRIQWNANINGRTFGLQFNYAYDGRDYAKIVEVDLNRDSDCFAWNTNDARLYFTWWRWGHLVGSAITNGCNRSIAIARVTVSWVPNLVHRSLWSITIDRSYFWIGTSSGGSFGLQRRAIPANSTMPIREMVFSDEMLGRDYSITWTFMDGSTTTTVFDMFAENQGACLIVNTSGSYIDNTAWWPRKIKGVTLGNTCSEDIGVTHLTVSWKGASIRRQVETRIYDSQGPATYWVHLYSGSHLDFLAQDRYYRHGGSQKSIDYVGFDSLIPAGTEFTFRFTMVDGSFKEVSFVPGQ